MQKYSDFFKTLHDEEGPTGYLGRGTHYSVLRALTFHDARRRPLLKAQFTDFAVIWDEDHDTRIFEPIEAIYCRGQLSSFLMLGERKGFFTAVLSKEVNEKSRIESLEAEVSAICQSLDDPWTSNVVFLEDPENHIIDDKDERVSLYLNNLRMLWRLGSVTRQGWPPFDPLLLKKVDAVFPNLSVRAAFALRNEDIIYIGDLVQKHEDEMLRGLNFGRKLLYEVKEALATLGLQLNTKVPDWPSPENIENLAKCFEDETVP
jgi:hypothetical protein